LATADRIAVEAEKAHAAGHLVSAHDGPGQPAALHFDGLVFRPDWEPMGSPSGSRVRPWCAGTHCHAGAGRLVFARIYDWLDDVLAGH
jgi:hypothetical protein